MTNIIDNRWEIIDNQSSQGGNAHVFKVKDTLQKIDGELALKQIKRFDRYERFKKEVMIASSLNHAGIARILASHLPIEPKKTNAPYYLMPWTSGGTLTSRLNRFTTVNSVFEFLDHFLPTIEYIHKQGYAHRDIKPSNILINQDDRPVLCDFGLVLDTEDLERATSIEEAIGSRGYRAPELVSKNLDNFDHRPADIYSIGKTIWAISSGTHPAEGKDLNLPELNLMNLKGKEWLDLQEIVRITTNKDIKSRPNIDELIKEISSNLSNHKPISNDSKTIGNALSKLYANDPKSIESQRKKRNSDEYDARLKEFQKEIQDQLSTYNGFLELKSSISSENVKVILLRPPFGGDPIGYKVYTPLNTFDISMTVIILKDDNERIKVKSNIFYNTKVYNEREFSTILTSTSKKAILGLIPSQFSVFLDYIKKHIEE